MGCNGCSTDSGKPKGCRSNGGCGTGGCNKLNTFDWLSTMELHDPNEDKLVEVSFRNGAHKAFYRLVDILQAETGDDVVVESDGGYDIGRVSLKGALVPIQMKKKSVDPNSALRQVMRVANSNDIDRLDQAIGLNKGALVKSRAIAATLGIDMKIGDVDYRADMKKATFYYTAHGRVDFRELIRHYAKEFRVKIEMRQIGSRQESSRIGGLGSCGRELCCSTWLTDFKSVTTGAARYQNLAINQAKLSGQCGRLKCCLNYELDVYMEALEGFPTNVDILRYANGQLKLIKTDIFKKLMFYIKKDERGREAFITLTVNDVFRIKEEIAQGRLPEDIVATKTESIEELDVIKSEDLTGHIELPDEKRRKKKKNNKNRPESNRNPKHSSDSTFNDKKDAGEGNRTSSNATQQNKDNQQGRGQQSGNRNPKGQSNRKPDVKREGRSNDRNNRREINDSGNSSNQNIPKNNQTGKEGQPGQPKRNNQGNRKFQNQRNPNNRNNIPNNPSDNNS